jgi:protein TonB
MAPPSLAVAGAGRQARSPVLFAKHDRPALQAAWRAILLSLGLHLLGLGPVALRVAWRTPPEPGPVWAKVEFVQRRTATVGVAAAQPPPVAAPPSAAPAPPVPDQGRPSPSRATRVAAAAPARPTLHYDPAIRLGDDEQSGAGLVRGSAVVPAQLDSRVHNRLPPYPHEARLLREQGEVIMLVHVGPDGNVAAVDLQRSSGYDALDRAAREAVWRWHFLPGARDGVPAQSETLVDLHFTLGGITR